VRPGAAANPPQAEMSASPARRSMHEPEYSPTLSPCRRSSCGLSYCSGGKPYRRFCGRPSCVVGLFGGRSDHPFRRCLSHSATIESPLTIFGKVADLLYLRQQRAHVRCFLRCANIIEGTQGIPIVCKRSIELINLSTSITKINQHSRFPISIAHIPKYL